MLINIKVKDIAVRLYDFIAGDYGNAVNCHFLFIIGIFTLIYADPQHKTAFSATADFGLANAYYRILAFFLKQLLEFGRYFGDHCYLHSKLRFKNREGLCGPSQTWLILVMPMRCDIQCA